MEIASLAAAAADMQSSQTRQALEMIVLKQQAEAEQALVAMLAEVAASLPQGGWRNPRRPGLARLRAQFASIHRELAVIMD